MNARFRFSLEILLVLLIALVAVSPLWPESNSQARIVRLSFVEGNVTVQRPDVPAWAEAPVNTPIQQGFKLSTGESSFAEIQFENGGTVRLGQLGLLEFTELQLAPDGRKINQLNLSQGYATFHPLPSRVGESLRVDTPYGSLAANGGTEFRVDLDQGVERVEVTNGAVEVRSDLGSLTLEKNFVLVMQPGALEPTVVSQGITKDDWDAWVDDRENRVTMSQGSPPPEGYAGDDDQASYGWSDLLQYGSWADVPGAGYGWSPNWMNAGWSPYSMGQWCWYPGWGYTWIGAEPWGWLPYHYGGWENIAGRGWIWFPGSHRGRWSPAQVTWFNGPGWVGWVPRPPRGNSLAACDSNCGGGVVTASTLRHGGLLTSNLMLGINPTMGVMVKSPGILPSMAAKLPGPAVSLPAVQIRSFVEKPAGGAASSPAARNTSAAPPNSAIVYDSRQDSYINGRRTTPQPSSTSRPAGAAFTPNASNPGVSQPVPAGSRDVSGQSGAFQGFNQPKPVTGTSPAEIVPAARGYVDASPSSPANFSARQGPSSPDGNSTGSRGSGSQAGGSHAGGGASSGGHSSPAPAGGGHAGGGSVGGGHH